ncbi:hypothetical protein B0O99DRAFT_621149 [Bisporella sp. PMI_857]|nr:hypothetical protein B0O99DRAFT_621149 [Bisporella sp. PMI_857]
MATSSPSAPPKTVLILNADSSFGIKLVNCFFEREYIVTSTIRSKNMGSYPFLDTLTTLCDQVFELDYSNVESIIRAAVAFGERPLDILINITVGPDPLPWKGYTQTCLSDMLQNAVTGPFLAMKYFYNHLRISSSGKIINMVASSNEGNNYFTPSQGLIFPGDTDYDLLIGFQICVGASKQLTRSMAANFKDSGDKITVHSFHLLGILTQLSTTDNDPRHNERLDNCTISVVTAIESRTMENTGEYVIACPD